MDPHGGKLWRKQRRRKGIGEAEDYRSHEKGGRMGFGLTGWVGF